MANVVCSSKVNLSVTAPNTSFIIIALKHLSSCSLTEQVKAYDYYYDYYVNSKP